MKTPENVTPEPVGSGHLVRLLVSLIYWGGIALMTLLVGLTLVGLAWILAQPGQIEAALCALGLCVIIFALIGVWVWAKMKRSEPNTKTCHGPEAKP